MFKLVKITLLIHKTSLKSSGGLTSQRAGAAMAVAADTAANTALENR